jgi:DNA invertase Pin-like site-specific DNA recombinase
LWRSMGCLIGQDLRRNKKPRPGATDKCFLDMLGVFAEFETNLRRERQLEGIAKAKAGAEMAA